MNMEPSSSSSSSSHVTVTSMNVPSASFVTQPFPGGVVVTNPIPCLVSLTGTRRFALNCKTNDPNQPFHVCAPGTLNSWKIPSTCSSKALRAAVRRLTDMLIPRCNQELKLSQFVCEEIRKDISDLLPTWECLLFSTTFEPPRSTVLVKYLHYSHDDALVDDSPRHTFTVEHVEQLQSHAMSREWDFFLQWLNIARDRLRRNHCFILPLELYSCTASSALRWFQQGFHTPKMLSHFPYGCDGEFPELTRGEYDVDFAWFQGRDEELSIKLAVVNCLLCTFPGYVPIKEVKSLQALRGAGIPDDDPGLMACYRKGLADGYRMRCSLLHEARKAAGVLMSRTQEDLLQSYEEMKIYPFGYSDSRRIVVYCIKRMCQNIAPRPVDALGQAASSGAGHMSSVTATVVSSDQVRATVPIYQTRELYTRGPYKSRARAYAAANVTTSLFAARHALNQSTSAFMHGGVVVEQPNVSRLRLTVPSVETSQSLMPQATIVSAAETCGVPMNTVADSPVDLSAVIASALRELNPVDEDEFAVPFGATAATSAPTQVAQDFLLVGNAGYSSGEAVIGSNLARAEEDRLAVASIAQGLAAAANTFLSNYPAGDDQHVVSSPLPDDLIDVKMEDIYQP